jgi:hypothetical protein
MSLSELLLKSSQSAWFGNYLDFSQLCQDEKAYFSKFFKKLFVFLEIDPIFICRNEKYNVE